MRKFKILHIIKSLGRGGAEMLLPETLLLHDKERFDFHYIYFLPWKNQMVNEISANGGKVTCLPVKNNVGLLLQIFKVSKYCRDEEIDLIHCHLPWSGFLGRGVFFKTGIPLIYTEHNIQERYHWATQYLNKLSFNSQTHALGVSQDVTDSIRDNIKPKIPVYTLLNGVNTEKYKKNTDKGRELRKKLSIPDDAVVIGNMAVFRKQKNISLWLRAFKRIVDDTPKVYGLLVGAGPEEETIKELVKSLKLEERVILPGLQSETVSFFSVMDIFMMTSSFEGLPVALLEAMSTNCAIISTKAGGVKEVIRNGVDGIICELEDEVGLATAAVDLVENFSSRLRFQVAARNRVKECFSLNQMVNKLEVIYIKEIQNDN